jgi:hypothetical protein
MRVNDESYGLSADCLVGDIIIQADKRALSTSDKTVAPKNFHYRLIFITRPIIIDVQVTATRSHLSAVHNPKLCLLNLSYPKVLIGSQCSTSSDCQSSIANSVCSTESVCQCETGYTADNTRTVCRVQSLGQPCGATKQCNMSISNSVCSPTQLICVCIDNSTPANNLTCTDPG